MAKKLTKYRKEKLTKSKKITISFILIILTLGVAYSALVSDLSILGDIVVKKHVGEHTITFPEQIENMLENETDTKRYIDEVTDLNGTTVSAKNVYFITNPEKRNIIFGGFCWQAIRTTETGGLKIIYNGEPVDGKCESTRANHTGILGAGATYSLNSSMLYGSSFTYNETNGVFELVDTMTATWSDATYESLIGKYTCKTQSNTCTRIYAVNGYYSDTSAYLSSYAIGSTHYSQIGTSVFNANSSPVSSVGYMYDKYYNSKMRSPAQESIGTNTYIYGDSYTDNGDGTYTINSPSEATSSNWSEIYSSFGKKYVCKNPTNNTCNELIYSIRGISSNYFTYYKSSEIYKFGNSFTYSNGMYTLSGGTIDYWNLLDSNYLEQLKNNHYTCWNDTGICDEIKYIYDHDGVTSGKIHYIPLKGGLGIDTAINNMLFDEEVNKYDSSIKLIIDYWYKNNMTDYTNYIEDVVYCNDRTIKELSNFNPDGGPVLYIDALTFKNGDNTTDLSCSNVTDQFAVGNNSAKLTYPVGLITSEEANNLAKTALLKTSKTYWTLSPARVYGYYPEAKSIVTNGRVLEDPTYEEGGVRPVISLKNSVMITSGSGSETDPWVVDTKYKLNKELINLSNVDSNITKYEGNVTEQPGLSQNASSVFFDKNSDKRNIIFGGFCWQVIRTTETGGTKVIYNGEPVDGKCESTRANHTGILGAGATYSLNSSMLYGSSFTYNETNGVFELVDTMTATWSDATYESLIGKYTCKTQSNTCTRIYAVNGYYSDTSAYLSSYAIGSTHYSQIGTSVFNANSSPVSSVGYMYDKYYNSKMRSPAQESIGTNTYIYGDSYTDNGDGTYTINSPSEATSSNWSEIYSSFGKKYVCKNPTNNTCNELIYSIRGISSNYFTYYKSSEIYKFGNSFTYSNGMYTLSGGTIDYWNLLDSNYLEQLKNNHYTCWNDTGICDEIKYIYDHDGVTSGKIHYIPLKGGLGIDTAINNMLFDEEVNKYDSSIKLIIDYWYKNNMTDYTNYIEDVVYCNDRTIKELSNFNPDGGPVLYIDALTFKNGDNTTDLSCSNVTDQFAVGNNSAKLTYPVGLITSEEANNLAKTALLKTSKTYWTLSPARVYGYYPEAKSIVTNGRVLEDPTYEEGGVRPVISLKNSVMITSGSGSETDPWIVS